MNEFFKLKENSSSISTECLARLTTFLTMSYIIFVNPAILAQTGMDQQSVFVATCLAAAIGTILIGLFIDLTNLEISISSVITVIIMPFTYSIANGIAFGLLFYVLTQLAQGKYREVHPI